jgi:ectoine hydroxylase-related dioxygenase (phytanoyl-CoA dioxygenase family)
VAKFDLPKKEQDVDLEKLKIELDEYGFVIIRELISRYEAELDAKRVVEIISRHSDGSNPDQHLRSFLDYLDPNDYPLFARLLAHPVCMELARHLVGEGFQLAEPGCRWRRPGASAGPVHITVPIERFAQSGLPTHNVCFVVPFAWMLNDLTAETGATFYLPFSQYAPGVPSQGMN